jgi:hypothetical protein
MNKEDRKYIAESNPISLEYSSVPISGTLSLEKADDNFLMVEIPQEFLDKVYESIQEDGMEKPKYRAHISVMYHDEIEKAGEIDEVGEEISVSLGPIMSVDPEGWDEMEKVWFIECDAPRLKEIRTKYGLTPLLNGDHEFHITVAVRPKEDDMRFSSKQSAIQYLADLTNSKVIIAKEELNDFMNEGRASSEGLTKEQVDQKELEMGIEIEKEHTSDKKMAEKIALDHLAEIPNYYTLLKEMEESAGIEV